MIKGNDNTRFARRLDVLFWWILRLLPLILMLIRWTGFFTAKPIWQYYVDDGDWSYFGPYALNLGTIFESFGFNYVNDISELFFNIFGNFCSFFDLNLFDVMPGFASYLSYLVFVEVARFFLNFLLFIVRWANSLFDNMCR